MFHVDDGDYTVNILACKFFSREGVGGVGICYLWGIKDSLSQLHRIKGVYLRWLLENKNDVEDWRVGSTNVYVTEGQGLCAACQKPPGPETPRSGWVRDRKK